MIRKACYLILLISLSGCIPKGFIIPDEAEEISEGPQLTITISPDPASTSETIAVTVASDRLLVDQPTVIITQNHEKKGMDITRTMETIDRLTWQGTYTIKSGYEGKALVEVFNALDENGNKRYGTASFEVLMPEKEAGEEETTAEAKEIPSEEMAIEYENVPWHDIRGEYGATRAPSLTNQKISNNISCIAGDEEKLWFGTNYGIGQYDKLTQSWKGFLNKKGGISNSIRCMAMDDDLVWFGSQGDGLFRYQKSTDKWLAFPNDNKCHDPNINDILIVNDLVWVATNRGLAKYDKLSKQWTAYTLQTTYDQIISEKITQIAWLYPYLWVGTDKGLMRYDSLSDVWEDQTTICNKNITCLFMDKNDLWIGMPDSGVIQYNTTDNATRTYTVSNGLYSNGVLSLKADTACVFVGHLGGISKLDKSLDTWSSFSQTKIGDIFRLLDNVQAVYLEDNGNPWIGMNSGLIDISQSELMEVIDPTIVELIPAMDTILSTGFPEITAKYEDNIGGSGISSFAVYLFIDGKQVSGTVSSQELYYKPTTPLTEGEHSLEIQVADKCGNIATRKNTFSIALPKLSYKLLVSQAFVKPGEEMSVTIDASEELIGTPTALLSFASVTTPSLFDGTSVLAPKLMENETETGTWTVFGSWTTKNRKQWKGTVKLPINAIGAGIITVKGLEDIHGQKPNDFQVARVMAINKEAVGIIAPRIISMATATIAGTTTNIITGTATAGSFVNLIIDGKVVRTVMADTAGNFEFKNISNVLIKAGTNTTTITTSATDKAKIANIANNVSETVITPELNLLIDFPKMASSTINIRGVSKQVIGTISGFVAYGTMSVPLNMAVNKIDIVSNTINNWVGSASIPSGVDGKGTVSIVAVDTYGQQATFIGTLSIDTIPPGTPTIAATNTATAGWVIYGTATDAVIVELWTNKGLAGTTTPSMAGTFTMKLPQQQIGTTTVWAMSRDKAGNRAQSQMIEIPAPLRISANLPPLAGSMLEVRGAANQALRTISGKLVYDKGSVALDMAIMDKTGGNDWVGSVSVPSGVDGMATVSIVAVDSYNQQATFIGTLSIDTIPPGTPTIAATNTATAGWVIYGTATDAVIVELWTNKGLAGTTTPSMAGTFTMKLPQQQIGTTTVWAMSRDKAGNRAQSQMIEIPAPLRISANLPPLAGSMLEVRGAANQALGTISGKLVYDKGSVALDMAIMDKTGGNDWVGSVSVPSGVDGMATVSIVAVDSYNQQATFIGTLSIDTTSPATPTITATNTIIAGWVIYGTATEAVIVELWTNKGLAGTTTPSMAGTFTMKLPQQQIGTTTVWAMSRDKAGNRAQSQMIEIPAPLRISANLPPLAGSMLEVRGAANQALRTISGKLVYDKGSVALDMAIMDKTGGNDWVGSVSVPSGVDGMATVSIVAVDSYNQQATFIGTLSIDTTSPATPTITATNTIIAGWVIYGTATEAVIVELWTNKGLAGTTTPSMAGTFTMKLPQQQIGTTTVWAMSRDKAGNRAQSQMIEIPAPLRISANLPPLAGSMLEVRGAANQALGTISGKLVYDKGSVALDMAIMDKTGGNDWVGSVSVPSGVDGMATVSIVAVDSYNQQATFIGTLSIDTTSPATPTITATNTIIAGWVIYGTATEAVIVELWTNKGLAGTTTPSMAGTFTMKLPQQQIGTTTVWAMSRDKAGNRAQSQMIEIPAPLRISANLPPLAGSMLEVRGAANQALGTISGKLVYDKGSVALDMAIMDKTGGNDWVGSVSVPSGVDGMATVSIVAVDSYNQQATFIGTLSIDTIPPEIPTIVVTNTAKDGWVVYGTATEAVIVELLWANQKQKMATTITPNTMGTFSFSLGSIAATTTVQAVSRDKAGNWVESEPLYIYPPIVPPPGTPTIAATNTTTGDWMIYGTATNAVMIKWWTDQNLSGTTTLSDVGTFSFSLRSSTATITVWAGSMNQAGNLARSEPLYIYPPIVPPPGTPTIAATNTTTGDWMIYGTATNAVMIKWWTDQNLSGTTTLSDVGTFSFSLRSSTATITVWAGSMNQAGNLARSEPLYIYPPIVPPPGTPTIAATNTTTGDWMIYGTATNAVMIKWWTDQNLSGTTTLSDVGTFSFSLRSSTATITVWAGSMNQAGNLARSEPLYIYPPIVPPPGTPTIAATNTTTPSDVGTFSFSLRSSTATIGQTTLKIPPDALAEDSQVMLTEISKSTGKLAVANFNVRQEKNITPVPDSYRSLVCTNQANGKPVSSTRQAMQLCIPYGDENHDGIVDETSICVETLKIFKLNEVSNRWEMLTDSYPVATKCEVRANIYEFGIYAIMSYEPVYSLSDVKVYPNPFYPNMNQKCKFSPLPSGRLTISIYNSAGEQVRVLRQYSNEGVEWDGNNDQGESVASGIYFYLIKNTEGKRTGKIGLVR